MNKEHAVTSGTTPNRYDKNSPLFDESHNINYIDNAVIAARHVCVAQTLGRQSPRLRNFKVALAGPFSPNLETLIRGGSRGCQGCPDTRPFHTVPYFEKNIFSKLAPIRRSDFGFLGSKVPQYGRFHAQDAHEPSCKI